MHVAMADTAAADPPDPATAMADPPDLATAAADPLDPATGRPLLLLSFFSLSLLSI
jgi:hypothetical protein